MGIKKSDLPPALQPGDPGERTAFCPDDTMIAACFEHRLRPGEHRRMSQHLADCGYCRSRLGMLARLEDARGDEEVSGVLLARAKLLAADAAPGPRRWPLAAAAAVVALLAVGVILNSQQHPGQRPAAAHPYPRDVESVVRQLRSVDNPALRPRIRHPADGAVLSPGPFEVSWTPVEGSLYYELLVLDESGATLVRERVQSTDWSSDPTPGLKPGGLYYLRVTASLADGRTSGSEHSAFSIASSEEPRR